MVSAYGNLNGSGPQQIYISNTRTSQSQANGTSTYRIIVKYIAKGYGSWSNTTQSWSASVNGANGKSWSGTFVIGSPGTADITLLDTSYTKTHDSSGNLAAFTATGSISTDHSSIGDGSISVTEPAPPRIAQEPSQVTGVTVKDATTTGFLVTWTAPSNGGASISSYDIQYDTDSAFSGTPTTTSTTTSKTFTTLTPGTKYYFRVRAKNSVGAGAWSATATGTTLPATPPGLTILASPSGTSATLTFTPPGGATGVYLYLWERRTPPTTSRDLNGETPNTTVTVTGQVPGVTYEWRAAAQFTGPGGYISPYTDWIALKQPKPNTEPGDYFDGATPDTPDLDYAWTGTANNSTSTATGTVPIGWEVTFSGTGAGVLTRVTAGIFGPYAARLVLTKDTSSEGVRLGQRNAAGYRTEVTAAATYVGSIHVMVNRSNSLAAEITWLNSAGGLISRTVGTPTVVAGGTWVRLVAGGVAPDLAEWAVVRVIDVSGPGWSLWQSGDIIDADGAMISLNEEFPYFDGDTDATLDYIYDWTGADHASTSTRTPLSQATRETLDTRLGGFDSLSAFAIVDPSCAAVPLPPRPPVIPSDCIEEVGVWRRYFVEIPATMVSDWLSVVPTLEVKTGTVSAKQVRIRYYPNPNGLASNQINTADWCSEQIISYMPAKTVMTIDGITQRVWAEVNTADAISADHLLYGTGGKPATWPILSCGIAYLVSLEVPVGAPVGNIQVAASLTTRT